MLGPKKCARSDRPPCCANYHYIVPVYHHRKSIYRLRVGVADDDARLWSVPRGLSFQGINPFCLRLLHWELARSERFNRGPMNDAAVCFKHRTVARTIPSARSIVPGHSAALVRAGRRKHVRSSVCILPNGEFLLSDRNHRPRARSDIVDALDARLRYPALMKILWISAGRVIQRRPRIRSALDLISD